MWPFGYVIPRINGTNLKYFVGSLLLNFLWTITNNLILLSDAMFCCSCACAISRVANFWPSVVIYKGFEWNWWKNVHWFVQVCHWLLHNEPLDYGTNKSSDINHIQIICWLINLCCRFAKNDIHQLLLHLSIPAFYKCPNGTVASGLEAFLILLRR
jgi:hypothetical protein